MADYQKILAALDSGLKAFAVANPLTFSYLGAVVYNAEAMDIAWENVSYTPKIGRPYLEVFLLPADSVQAGNGQTKATLEKGVYQVGVWFPRDEGAGAAIGRADLLRQYFDRSRQLSFGGVSVQVERTPSLSPAAIGADWYTRYVSIPFFTYS